MGCRRAGEGDDGLATSQPARPLYPLAAFVMVALAVPFGGAYSRVGGMGLKIFSGAMIGILFHMLNGLFSNLGAINNWSPLLSAVTPSALFLLAATAMIWWVERR